MALFWELAALCQVDHTMATSTWTSCAALRLLPVAIKWIYHLLDLLHISPQLQAEMTIKTSIRPASLQAPPAWRAWTRARTRLWAREPLNKPPLSPRDDQNGRNSADERFLLNKPPI